MFKKELGFGYCGIACHSCAFNANCPGCRSGRCERASVCQVFQCASKKGIAGCWECSDFPCNKDMMQMPKCVGSCMAIKEAGEEKVTECMLQNEAEGMVYMREGITGDYDALGSAENIKIKLLRK